MDWIIVQQILTLPTPAFHCRQSVPPSPMDVGLGHMSCFGQRNISLHDAQRLKCACVVWLDTYASGICHKKSMPQEAPSFSLSQRKDRHAAHQNPAQSLELSPANMQPNAALPSCIGLTKYLLLFFP